MAISPEAMAQTMFDNLADKTGKPLDRWLSICQQSKLEKHGALVKHLKTEYGVTHGYANLIAHSYLNRGEDTTTTNLIMTQYAGAKAQLKPIYDALMDQIQHFGDDIEIAPKKAYVSLRRHKQFALIQPSTKTRVDVGLNLKGTTATDRLEQSGSFNAMVSHRVRLTATDQVDQELINWLKQAYQAG